MLFVAFAMSVYIPAFAGFQGAENWTHEYLPRSFPRLACVHDRPPSVDTITSLIPYPPENATPLIIIGLFFFSVSPSPGVMMSDRVDMRWIGIVLDGFDPGGMQPHSVSG